MKDLEIHFSNEPGNLALMGKVLGENNISLEGGGVFEVGEYSLAHFLVTDGEKAKRVLEAKNMIVKRVNNVILLKLRQDVPGQLGEFCSRLASNGVNILIQYSDHDNQLVIVPDNYEKAQELADQWMDEWW